MQILARTESGLESLEPLPFPDEKLLQATIEHNPGLVLAAAPNEERVPIWTIGSEVGVSSGSIDLLLLDATGRVWVIETKLKKNAEVRKHVIGQVLAYCGDIARWSMAELEQQADGYMASPFRECVADVVDPAFVLETAALRLSRGDLTALVVVDDLNHILRRAVEFVNAHAEFELLAMKIETFRLGALELFVPQVVGLFEPRRLQSKAPYDSEVASGPASELDRKLRGLARTEGWEIETTHRVANVRTPAGETICAFNPGTGHVQFFLSQLRAEGQQAVASDVLMGMSVLTERKLPRSMPHLTVAEVLAHWTDFETLARRMAAAHFGE